MHALRFAKPLIMLTALLPAACLTYGAMTDQLGANPIEKVLRSTGFWTLSLLWMTLSITPLRRLTGHPWVGQFRRMLGLSAFFYAILHVLTYVCIDQFFDWKSIVKDVVKHPYLMVGFSAFVLLIPLAITSLSVVRRRMGGARWRGLHRLVYLIAILGVIHFGWLVKKDMREPMLFATGLMVLFLARIQRDRSS